MILQIDNIEGSKKMRIFCFVLVRIGMTLGDGIALTGFEDFNALA